MKSKEVNKLANQALTEYVRERMCLVNDGTGNLFATANRYFIVTCFHIAQDFFNGSQYKYVVLRNNRRILKENLELIASQKDDIDIALIEIHAPLDDCNYYSMQDIEVVKTFRMDDFSNTNLILCGNPGDLITEKPPGLFYMPLTYTTLPLESKLPCSDYLYCQYPVNKLVINNETNDRIQLPKAKGLSGAFILKVKTFDAPINQIWSSQVTKIVAIQQSWDKNSYVKGTNIKYLIELLHKIGAA